MRSYHSASGSAAEDLFIDLFSESFGAEKAEYLYSQYHFYNIYQSSRYAGKTLFLVHTQEPVNQAAETFRKLWPSVTVGRYMESMKQPNAHVL